MRKLLSERLGWAGASLAKVTYCTAVIDSAANPSGFHDQDIYLRALRAADSVDHIEYGTYVARCAASRRTGRAGTGGAR